VTIEKQDPVQRMGDEMTGLWRHMGELVRGQSRIEGRLDRVEGDVAVLKEDVGVLKGDVGELKTGLAGTNQRLDRLELSTERRFNRIDAQLERLIALVQRAETKGC
jgi:DNA anti-recombination protein RmuC